MFCWPLIASRVAFSSVKWKKFHLSDLSVSWCLCSMIVMGNDSCFISNHFSVQVKWIVNFQVIYTVRVCFVQEHCVCSPRRSSTSPSYSQQMKVVSISNLFLYLHVHRVGLWHNNCTLQENLIFSMELCKKPWTWRNGPSGSSSLKFCDKVSNDIMSTRQVIFYFKNCRLTLCEDLLVFNY